MVGTCPGNRLAAHVVVLAPHECIGDVGGQDGQQEEPKGEAELQADVVAGAAVRVLLGVRAAALEHAAGVHEAGGDVRQRLGDRLLTCTARIFFFTTLCSQHAAVSALDRQKTAP